MCEGVDVFKCSGVQVDSLFKFYPSSKMIFCLNAEWYK